MNWRSLAPAFVLLLSYPARHAPSLDAPGAVKAAIEAKYHVTQATADDSDIVTAGDVIALLKSGLVMYDPTKSASRTGVVSYHDGKLNAGGMTRMMLAGSAPNSAVQVRQFVSGEKCWLVAVTIKNDGVYLTFLSDPINDIRYMGSIKFPVDKKQSMPGLWVTRAATGTEQSVKNGKRCGSTPVMPLLAIISAMPSSKRVCTLRPGTSTTRRRPLDPANQTFKGNLAHVQKRLNP